MRLHTLGIFLASLLLSLTPTTRLDAQDFRGRITGTVTDNTGAVLPGVTVIASGPALIQPQEQISATDGTFRFLALPAGVYEVAFELTGFQGTRREGIRVVIGQTLTVDQQLQLGTVQETVTVTGQSPIVDTSTTTMGTNFTKELLTEIPNARDIWAAMSQAPGLQMTSYDVGGSRSGTSTGFRSYGMDTQNQTRLEGIDTTEGTAGNAGYFDFGSFEEFQVGGAGSDAASFAGGAVLTISVKSGGDKFSGSWYSDWEGDSTISENVPDNLRVSNQKDDNGFYVREPLSRGNPIDRQYDINANLGGPLWRKHAWFFASYRLNDQYKTVLGIDDLARSKLTNPYSLKGTFQLPKNNQIIAFINKREKLQDKRGLGPNIPLSATQYQASANYPAKVEWTSVLGSRAFLDVMWASWRNYFPLRPADEAGTYPNTLLPGRIDVGTSVRFDGGSHDSYQNQDRFKPQVYLSLSYFQDGWLGSHDFKLGYDWKRDRRIDANDQPFDSFYRDNLGALNQVDIYNTPVAPINDVVYNSAWLADTWKLTNRLTLNLGVRFERYRDGWNEQQFAPNGHPFLADFNDPVYREFVAARTVDQRTVALTNTFAPRVGFAFDLTGDNRTVLKAYVGQSRWNSADTLADQENPLGVAQLRYEFVSCSTTRTANCDFNGNRLVDSGAELGRLISTQGGGGFVRVDRGLVRPTTNEVSVNVERELLTALSGRVSYVYKNIRNVWAEYDALRAPAYTIPITITDPGPDNRLGTGDEQTIQTFDRPANFGQDRVYTNPANNGADFHNVEFAINRRFAGRWMLLSSAGYTWSLMPTNLTGYDRAYSYRPARLLFADDRGRETTTLWNYKVVGRYTLPWGIGTSGSWKVQSGQQYGRTINFTFPGDGAQTFRVEPVTARRYPTVGILDLRLDKRFDLGRFGRLTGMVDVFNLANAGTVTSLRTTVANFQEVTGLLDPRIVRFGVRFDF